MQQGELCQRWPSCATPSHKCHEQAGTPQRGHLWVNGTGQVFIIMHCLPEAQRGIASCAASERSEVKLSSLAIMSFVVTTTDVE